MPQALQKTAVRVPSSVDRRLLLVEETLRSVDGLDLQPFEVKAYYHLLEFQDGQLRPTAETDRLIDLCVDVLRQPRGGVRVRQP